MDGRADPNRPGSGVRARQLAPAACVLCVLVAVAVAAVWRGFAEERRSRVRASGLSVTELDRGPTTVVFAVPAGDAALSDDARVIGVVVGQYPRAYEVGVLARYHVLNDVVEATPVTIAYCPRTSCTRVYTGPPGSGRLGVAVGGWAGRPGLGPDASAVMLLRVGSRNYFQDTGGAVDDEGSFPYAEREFERTSWGEWRRAHPGTDAVTLASQH